MGIEKYVLGLCWTDIFKVSCQSFIGAGETKELMVIYATEQHFSYTNWP